MTHKIGNGSMPLRIGNLINTKVYGGPYLDVPVDFFGVKMAEEIEHPHMVDIPTRDFDVPKVSDLRAGIIKTLMGLINDEVVYVGCMGGIGRTGIFLAALAKVQIEYRKVKHRPGRGEDPVLYVRKHFIPHALETEQQMKFIADFDVAGIVTWLCYTQAAMGLNIGFQKANDDVYSAESIATATGRLSASEPNKANTPKPERPIDADCVTLPNGDCVAEGPCMHTPVTEMTREEAGTHTHEIPTADLSNKGPVTPIYDEHEEIPMDYLDATNVQLKYERHRAQWRERWDNTLEQTVNQDYEDQDDTDSVDPENLQTQIWKLEDKVTALKEAQLEMIDIVREVQESKMKLGEALEDLAWVTDAGLRQALTKQTWYERIRVWLKAN